MADIQLTNATVTFGGRPVFSSVDLALGEGERACLVGRNGSGKTTLLKVLAGRVDLDQGERFVQPGAAIGYLPQEPVFGDAATAEDYAQSRLDDEGVRRFHALAERLGIQQDAALASLSGGEARRVDLATVLAGRPEILLLDEPTNHLDLPTIEWLQQELSRWRGAMLLISHDRAFLAAVTNRVCWIDRGVMRRLGDGFSAFEGWEEQVLAAEAQEQARLNKRLQAETHWLHRGVTARRKRNEGRLRALKALRQDMAEHIGPTGGAKLEVTTATAGGSLVMEALHVTKSLGDRVVVDDFSIRIRRGARIGIIGRNGAGKTTLLRLLTGDLAPDKGKIRLGMGLEAVYFDQNRAALDPDMTLWNVMGEGNDQIFVQGKPRHVVTYLRDFLFTDEQANGPVKALSGGERARLLLAKLFAKPSNLIVLDEPTNDLDMDTLDLLQEVIAEYDGTVLLVSHDRDFLDRTVTSTLVFEGDGKISAYAGGYTDYLRQRPQPVEAKGDAKPGGKPTRPRTGSTSSTRLTYKDQRELDLLPGQIAKMDAEIASLEAKLADPDFYRRDAAGFASVTAKLDTLRAGHAAAEDRWLELQMMADAAQVQQ